MNDSPINFFASHDTYQKEEQPQDADSQTSEPQTSEPQAVEPQAVEPQFGAVDIVEAFTAMRHEWRGQTRESRDLAGQIQAAVVMLQDLKTNQLEHATQNNNGTIEIARQLARVVAETDHQLTRALRAVEQTDTNRQLREKAEMHALQIHISNMKPLTRWLTRSLTNFLTEQQRAREQIVQNQAIEGLNLLLARLRISMKEHQIERIETEGQPFDANLMNAIGTMQTTDFPSGHVAEQLSPCYRWQGEVISFANVRVANSPNISQKQEL